MGFTTFALLIMDLLISTLCTACADGLLSSFFAATAYSAPPSAFDSHAHLLHGVIHANGFGHLARVNGREGGSQQLTGV